MSSDNEDLDINSIEDAKRAFEFYSAEEVNMFNINILWIISIDPIY